MTLTCEQKRARRSGGIAARLAVALAVLVGALAFIVTRPEPAAAWTIQRMPDKIVLTSERLHALTVRATVVVTLQRDGDVILRAQDVHNSGRTRKFYRVEGTVNIPVIGLDIFMYNPGDATYRRIGSDSTHSREERRYYQELYDNWDRIGSHAIDAHLRLSAKRVYVP